MDVDANGTSDATHGKKQRVAYFYDAEVGNFYYGQVYKPGKLTFNEMTKFHSDEYVDFLRCITPENQHEHSRQLKKFNVGEDCPVFDGLYDYCQTYGGGSVGGAHKLNERSVECAVNWAGGLHHAKKSEASGFCYVNDIVLAILELLKYHQRVLYVDIDIHHGDGVEEAFFTTDRVMTVSFHKFGEGYFPGTGHQDDIGYGNGKHYALNVPLSDGIDDESYDCLFKPIMRKVMEKFRPNAVVFQSGTDSLSGDRLGCFNLSIKGHSECLRFMRSFDVPLLLLGGGGYTIRNVARCWCYETACLAGVELEDKLPYNDYYAYFGPNFRLHIQPSNMLNRNAQSDLDQTRNTLLARLSELNNAPSVPFQPVPEDAVKEKDDEAGGSS